MGSPTTNNIGEEYAENNHAPYGFYNRNLGVEQLMGPRTRLVKQRVMKEHLHRVGITWSVLEEKCGLIIPGADDS